ncbi:MAG TPA: hypothetical protein VFG76_08895 [Candidatus Polarisedimenticolia bacterium]|nr:hypothetical protein [Candidatus Polarisedimenticolia bacterium]
MTAAHFVARGVSLSQIMFHVSAMLSVWFPDALAYLGWVRGAGHGRGPSPLPGGFLRFLGWAMLLTMLGLSVPQAVMRFFEGLP